jgi:hypothetical protein
MTHYGAGCRHRNKSHMVVWRRVGAVGVSGIYQSGAFDDERSVIPDVRYSFSQLAVTALSMQLQEC